MNNINRISFSTILLLTSFLLISCSSKIKDSSLNNNEPLSSMQNNKKRVIALTSLTADIVNRLDSDSLVAIPGSRLLKNNQEFKDKIVVSQGRNPPSIEKIIALKPDLVLGAKGFHDKALSQVKDLGVEIISTEIKNWNDLDLLTQEISNYLNVDNPSLYSLAPYCNQLSDESSNESTIVLVSSSPLLSPNKKSWAGSILNKFSINNLINDIQSKSGFDGYVTLSPETLLEKNPNNIILIDTGNDMKKLFLSKSYTSNLKAVENNNIFNFDYYGLINPGSIDSINNACEKLIEL
tara:strand:- start:235 stop:1116 length:882 start_codon:yes stop_codon:yes gene_type:complete